MTFGQAISVVQLTDTHLYADPDKRMFGVDTHQTLKDVVESVIGHGRPDVVLLTGDVSQDESPESYRRVYDLVKRINVPVYFLPGNHDLPRTMYGEFTDEKVPFKSERSVVLGDWLIVMLDSTIEGHIEGALGPEELSWLDEELAKHVGKHVMVCLHHNPFSVGTGAFNEYGLTNGDEFFAVLDRHDNVRVVVCGHVHQDFAGLHRGTVRLITTPSTCVQFKPNAPEFGLDAKPPGYRRFMLQPDGSIETAVHRLPSLPEGINLAARIGK